MREYTVILSILRYPDFQGAITVMPDRNDCYLFHADHFVQQQFSAIYYRFQVMRWRVALP